MRIGLVVLLLAGCVKTNTVQCEDGRICPADFVCDEAHAGCVHPGQLTACMGLTDKDPCTVDATDDGLCDQGVCLQKTCGDGVRTDNELCDKTDLGSGNCTDFGYYRSKQPACNNACNYDVTSCLDAGYCGDGVVDAPIEICEGTGRPADAECVDYGYGAGVLGCSACGPKFDQCERFGWQVATVPGSGTAAVSDVYGVSASDLYAVGGTELFHFNGTTWTNVNLGSCGTFTTNFTIVWQAAPDVVFAANLNGSVIRVDHGTCTKWTVFSAGQPSDLTGTSPTDVWATTTSTYGIAHFDGSQWTQQTLSGGSTIQAIQIFAPSSADAFAVVSATSKVARYTQGAWALPVTISGMSNPRVVFGTSANDYFIGGANSGVATLLHWTGSAYVPVPGLAPYLVGATSSSIFTGTTIGARTFVGVITLNGPLETDYLLEYDGTSWTNLRAPILPGTPWVSPDGQIYAPLGLSNELSWFPRSLRTDFAPFYGSISAQLAVRSTSDAYLAAANGLFHWNGLAWGAVNTAAPSWDVAVAPTGEVYAIDTTTTPNPTGGLQYFTTTWQTDTALLGSYAITAVAANNVFTVDSSNRKLWHWTGPGTGVPVIVPGTDFPTDVWAASTTAVFTVDSGNAVREYNGSTWTTLPALPSAAPSSLFFVWGRSATDLYTGGRDMLFHFNGTAWTAIPLPVHTYVTGVWGKNENELFIAAEERGLLYWNGSELSPVDDGTPFTVYSIAGSGDALFYTDFGKIAHELIHTGTWH